jgi:V-type H+-transporting ATPase subunit a
MHKLYIKKEKFKLTALNKCTHLGNFYEARVCIPEKKLGLINKALCESSKKYHYQFFIEDLNIPEGFLYPTYFELNDFTFPFQEIVNTYGTPRYQEINPSLFNIVTFPFLFGVMFGDIGHGLMLFLFGSYLILNSENINKGNNVLLKTFSKARYLLFLMGFFAFYCGWMYNDFLSIPLDLFGSCYTNDAVIY